MSPTQLLLTLLLLTAGGFYIGRRQAFAVSSTKGGPKVLHSRPTYYGSLTALWCAVPALIVFSFWLAFESSVITDIMIAALPEDIRTLPADRLNLIVNDIRNLVSGNIVGGKISPAIQAAADHYRSMKATSHAALSVLVVALAIVAILGIRKVISPALRARNHVENVIKVLLIACSTLAIFTTIGIVLSVLYEAIRFFQIIPISEFLLGLEW
ncbi:MAG TPA: phosphate ABC transporter permease subunit PstC, partial [Desulfobacteraceae bacterium]|nr:phosphate ABC transporter permease subunit PstC [Desulfobacteraceae bacterium]